MTAAPRRGRAGAIRTPGSPAQGRSSARRRTPGLVAILAALLFALLAPAAGITGAAPALAAATDLTLVTDATYEVRPDARLVHVTVRIVARNHTVETRTHKYYFDHAFLAVLPGTSGFRFTGASGAKVRVANKTASATLLRLDFGPRLYSGASRTYALSFDLKDAGARADGQIRIGRSLATFPVWAFASDGATGSTVKVTFPAGYAVTVESGAFPHTVTGAGGATQLSTDALDKPLSWFAYVVGQQQATYAQVPLGVKVAGGSIALVLRPWDDDPAWAKRVGGLFSRALPVLRDAIGLAWPHQDPTIVEEAVSRTTGGYAGLYDPTASRIEVAYWADRLVVIHEAAHGWFNGSLVAERWAAEGFASLYAERAAAALKEKGTSPGLTDAVAAARIPLNAWTQQAGNADRATETYGYAASLVLARAIAERAGDEALRHVWSDAAARVGAYQPPVAAGTGAGARPANPELVTSAPDWRSLLDLLEDRTGKDFTDLWRTWVVREDEAALLDSRAAARTSYARTLALAKGWDLPSGIRDALRAWQFDTAEQLMADARTVLAQRTAVEARATRNGLQVPDVMQRDFEAGSLVDASHEAEAELNAMLTFEAATAERPVDPDILTRIGLLGADPDADLAKAKAAFESDNLDASIASASSAVSAWSSAWQEGRRRALLAVAVLATLIVLVSAVVGGYRRARRTARVASG